MALDAISGSGIGQTGYSQTKASAAVSKNQDPQKTSQKAYSSVEEKGLNKEPVKATRPTTDRVELQANAGVSDTAKTDATKAEPAKKAYTLTDNPAKTAVRNATIAKSTLAKTTPAKTTPSTAADGIASKLSEVNTGKAQLPADTMAELIKAATEASDRISSFNAQNNRSSDSKIQDLNDYVKNNSSENISKLVNNNATQNQMAALMMMK